MQPIQTLAHITDKVFCCRNTPDLRFINSFWYPAQIVEDERWERGWHFQLDRKTGVCVPKEVERLIRTPSFIIDNQRYTLDQAQYILKHFYIPLPQLNQEAYKAAWRLLEVLEYVFHFDLKQFQQDAVAKALLRKGGILAFDPGLGKTPSALAFAAACTTLPRWRQLSAKAITNQTLPELTQTLFREKFAPRVLIVSPAGLVEQWQKEALKFLKIPLTVVTSHSQARDLPRTFWAITHYDAISRRGDRKLYKHFPPAKTLIFDEIHNIKNDSLRSKAARALRGEYRLGLSGTLMERPRDLFWPLWAVLGRRMGYSYHERHKLHDACTTKRFFLANGKRVGRGQAEPTVCNPLPVWKALAHVTTVSLEDVGTLLQPFERRVMHVPFGEAQLQSYLAWLKLFPEYVLEKHPQIGWQYEEIVRWGAFLGQDTFLHQACILPENLPRWPSTNATPKNMAVLELAQDLVAKDNLVVIFSARKLAGQWFAAQLQQRGIPTAHILNGKNTLSPEERINVVREFKDGKYRVLCATPQALGEGYNLVEASAVIMQSFNFSYSSFAQAIGRVRRLTSPKPIQAFVFVTKDSLEEIIWERILTKERSANLATRIPKEDMQKAIERTRELLSHSPLKALAPFEQNVPFQHSNLPALLARCV